MLYSLSPATRACSLAHIAHSIFPMAFPSAASLQTTATHKEATHSSDCFYKEEQVFTKSEVCVCVYRRA